MTDHQNLSFRATGRSLGVQTQVCGNAFIFLCKGRLVFGDECAVLRDRVSSMLLGSPNIVVSLREVDYIDSGGIGVLIGLLVSARNRGGDLKLVAPNQHVTNVLRRTNLHTIIELYADDDKAVAAFHQVPLQNALGKIADGQNPTTTTHLSAE
ncbi:MAG TPA: STAS domain-containing protein [Candidatus Eremiobacteraceae bacterium]|nr:STAS domain-containing protein [Candidatus Eremiobacteraceae bacterium]